MLSRLVVAAIVCSGLASVSPTVEVHAQADQAAATQLYELGQQRFEVGNLEGARDALRRVDPQALSQPERVEYYQLLQRVEAGLNGGAPAALDTPPAAEADGTNMTQPPLEQVMDPMPVADGDDRMQQLEQAGAMLDDDPAGSLSAYQQLAADPQTPPAVRQQASAGAAEAQRRIDRDRTAVRRLIALAGRDIEQGNYAAAAAKHESIQQADVQLGWFEQNQLDQQQQVVAQNTPAGGFAPVPVAQAPAPDPDPMAVAQAEPTPVERLDDLPTAGPDPGTNVPVEQIDEPGSDLLTRARMQQTQRLMDQAEDFEQRGQYRLAAQSYQDALLNDPDNVEAQAGLSRVEAELAVTRAPRGPLEARGVEVQVLQQRAEATFNDRMAEARELLRDDEYAAAQDAVDLAQTGLERDERFFSSTDFNALLRQAENLESQIADERQADRVAMERDTNAAEAREAQMARRIAEQEERQRVQSLLIQARALQREMRYEESLELLDQALFLEPNNVAAQAMRDMIQDVLPVLRYQEAIRERNLRTANLAVDNIEATQPPLDIMEYPDIWPQLTQRRLAALDTGGGESEASRNAAQALRRIVDANFEANSFEQVINYLRNSTGANIAVNWPALELAGVDRNRLISLQLSNVPAEQLLELVLDQAGAEVQDIDPIGYSIIEGVVTISTERDLQRSTIARVYDIDDLLVTVPDFAEAPAFDLNEALSNTESGGSNQNSGGGGGGGGGGFGGGGGGLFGDDADSAEEVELSREDLVAQIQDLITTTVGESEDWQLQDSTLQELNGNLIVRTTPDNHRSIIELLAQLRESRAIQISVEARFLLVDRNFLEEFGVDIDASYRSSGNFGPITIAQDTIGLGSSQATDLTPDGFVADTPLDNSTGFAATDPIGRSLALGVSFIDDLEVDLLVRATLANRRSISLTAPRVTFFNGQRAYVLVARQIAFISDLEPIPDAIGFDVTLSVTQAGVILDVEGTVSADRRYVTLTLRPSLANIVQPIRTIPQSSVFVIEGDDDTPDTIIPFSAFVEAPELEITSVRATVSVPDRGTLLLGGQRLVGEVEVESGVPVLSKIPILNRLFTNTSTVKDERTLLILVKPTIIIQREQEDLLFPGLNDDADAFNRGLIE